MRTSTVAQSCSNAKFILNELAYEGWLDKYFNVHTVEPHHLERSNRKIVGDSGRSSR